MDELQPYSALLKLKLPWKVEKVSLDFVKKTVKNTHSAREGFKASLPGMQEGMDGL